ncbi:(2Fe-2S) ferredoxin domain-containing protein [Mycolicibacterium sp. 018/SC-01/001]|uniref:(2Fe-2S) ferredoxin domain-containing protein n=1 Tax=Mycolicibacterium sp. 018/SC-01/001 TaxID=2592069 RepID=UPI00117F50F8|nr:(2Fe-2S) ferredoxin domain-containing protein [Mycolicibacterium sp. 018/SC-01/001]TRW79120.1 (2Fe-2S) ferredoxin domain-containing protein [Mycolicibacterium sp. 018/SC-01/001]
MALDRTKPTVTLCRGCCCGTSKKHPDNDHEAQVSSLRTVLHEVADLRITDCLGPCERSNVLVVTPSADGYRRGGRSTWLGYVFDETSGSAIAEWLRDGGLGVSEFPRSLRRHRFTRPRKRR